MTRKPDQPYHNPRELQFGPFKLDTHRRVINQAGSPLHLGSRAREILTTLLERAGETVGKQELMARVWPHRFVDEGTLRVHISALRKALRAGEPGGHYIENVTGYGYRYVGPVTQRSVTEQVPGVRFPSVPLIGRAGPISTITESLPNRRLVTIVGPGGVGKTAVAMACADRLRASYPDGVCLVDLSGDTDSFSIARSVAAALGLPKDPKDVLSAVIQYLKSRRTLVVLDSCERVVDAAAVLAEDLLGELPNVDVIATSREPLRAKGEWLVRLGPLDLPAPPTPRTAEQALEFSAIQLFVERASASLPNFELHDADASAVVDICRRLDGLPLPIELAAARVDLFGVRGLAARLHDGLGLLTRGYRTAVPRHQSLRALLAWSYQTLTPFEQIVLQRLAVFTAPFDLASATAVVIDEAIDATDALDILANLTAKSLLLADAAGGQILYRLFEASRAFALEKLQYSADLADIRRRHARLKSKVANTALLPGN
jgi:predicted ATPase/DNA-binding winged helix-turn-helix (wHTH) protein